MIVYSIFVGDGYDSGSSYFATLREAREARERYGANAEIEKLWLVDLPPRALAVRLLNGAQFVACRKVAVSAEPAEVSE